jgi:hypothetical protein
MRGEGQGEGQTPPKALIFGDISLFFRSSLMAGFPPLRTR